MTFEDFRSRLNLLLQHRAEVYPVRDERYAELLDEIEEFCHWLAEHIPSAWQSDPVRLEQAGSLQPIFVGGYRKSGTTLFLNLLDGHPAISVMPAGDARLLDFARKIADEPDALFRQQKKWLHITIVGSGLPPYWLFGEEASPYFDLLAYISYWLGQVDDPLRRHIEGIAKAYACANPNTLPDCRYWLDKTPLQELDLDQLLELYSHLKFIHVVRNPLAALAAVERINTDREWGFSLSRDTAELRTSMRQGLENAARLGTDRYRIVRYEDFVREPARVMRDIADWLDIPYQQGLLQPTVNGIPSVSNSAFKENRLEGKIHPRSLERWREALSPFEIKHIQQTLYDEACAYGYSRKELGVSAIFPAELRAKRWIRGMRRRLSP
jgi:hypothetical protein